MNNEIMTQLKNMDDRIYSELQTIYALVFINENHKKIDVVELDNLIKEYSKTSTMIYLECLMLFRLDIYKGKSYDETFKKFLEGK